jgi:hypothetical protein
MRCGNNVLVPYSRFLACQDLRRGIAAQPSRPAQPPTVHADAAPAPRAGTAPPQPLTANNVER